MQRRLETTPGHSLSSIALGEAIVDLINFKERLSYCEHDFIDKLVRRLEKQFLVARRLEQRRTAARC